MLIHSLFEKLVDLWPHSTAIQMAGVSLSYKDLEERSNRISNALISSGVRPGEIVGICLKRSPDLIATMMGILKAGAAYLPLDPEYPKDRLLYMIEHSGVKKILLHDSHVEIFKNCQVERVLLRGMNLKEQSTKRPNVKIQNDSLVYVIYTSGSTGSPKGVALGHSALVNLINWQNSQTTLGENSITLQYTPISFDVHFQEIFSTLTIGGKLVLIPEELRFDSLELLKTITHQKINRLYLPYVALNQLCETGTTFNVFPHCLKEVTTAGEQLKITEHIRSFFSKLENTVLFNHYGPSESHVVTSYTLSGKPESWEGLPPIGKSITGSKLHILNENKEAVDIGKEGEIHISGVCLAQGYLNAKELTEEKFIQIPGIGRVYKTGDLGYLDGKEDCHYLGRMDGQVKIRGHRIELGEVELSLQRIEDVTLGAVKVIEAENEKYLCAYYTGEALSQNIRDKLKNSLPDYMIPSFYVRMESLPMTPSGKIDRKVLPDPPRQRPELMNDFVLPETQVEKSIAEVWRKSLKINDIGIHDSFFDLGGNSLSAAKVVIDLNRLNIKQINVVEFFNYPTISHLARFMEGQEAGLKEKNTRSESNSNHHDIAVIAMTGRFPGARNIEEFWNNLLEGKNTLEKFSRDEIHHSVEEDEFNDPNYVFVQGLMPEYKSFDYKLFGMTPREAELMDPQQRKFLELSWEALEMAGYVPEKFDGSIGVFAGSGNSKYGKLVDQHSDKVKQAGEFNVMLGLEKDYIATRVAHKLNLTGPALSIHTGCSTSLVALVEAVKSLRLKHCDMALAGGISISGSSNIGHLYQEGGILSKDGTCRPFDEEASGTIFSDGAGVVVLKRLDDAERDGDEIKAVIKGIGINNDGANKMSFSAPSMTGQMRVITEAHKDAQIDPASIGYVETHGTATPVGDPIELEALTKAFSSPEKGYCYLGSLKSNIGHLTAAAGISGFIKTVLSLQKGIIPGTVNFKNPNGNLNLSETPFVISSSAEEFVRKEFPRRAGVSSFGVGGTNAHVILEEYISENFYSHEVNGPTLFKLSAKNEVQLLSLQEKLIDKIQNSAALEWRKIAYTLEAGRREHSFRRALVITPESLRDKKYLSTKYGNDHSAKTVFMMPGQGSHYPEMGKKLYNDSVLFSSVFDYCCNYLKNKLNYDLKEIIFDASQSHKLDDTFYSQPAIFIIEYSLGKMLIDMGIKPDMLIGHSIGEYAAATLAGVFSLDDGLNVIAKRAELMKDLAPGMMLSVRKSYEELMPMIEELKVDLAAVNGPQSCVISGAIEKVISFQNKLEKKGIASIVLKTSHAFHSRMMCPVVERFQKFLDEIPKNLPAIPIWSTVTTNNETNLLCRSEYWAGHIVNTVQFGPTIQKILKDVNNVLIEVGPGATLCKLLRKMGGSSQMKGIKTISALGESSLNESSNLLLALGELWCLGKKFNGEILYRPEEKRRTHKAPTYEFEKNSVWLEDEKIQRKNAVLIQKQPEGKAMSDSKKESLENKLATIFESSSGVTITKEQYKANFLEMGMDSLFLTQVSLQIKKELKVNITFRQLLESYSSIESLARFLMDKVEVEVEAEANMTVMDPSELSLKEVKNEDIHLKMKGGLENIFAQQLSIINQQIQILKSEKSFRSEVDLKRKEEDSLSKAAGATKRGADIRKSENPFGASPKIFVHRTQKMSIEQSQMINDFYAKYNSKTIGSKKFTQKFRKLHADPRVVSGFKPENKEIVYPLVVNKSRDQHLWDIDGNEYVDMTCGFGSNFFGNGNKKIKELVIQQLEEGIEIGPQHPLVGEVSRLISELTGNERSAFCNTGSEAVLGAMRIARTVTGREKIIVFSGSYHGINDEVIVRKSNNGQPYPAAPGISSSSVSNIVVLDYGTDESLKIIKEMSNEIAAVLVEPVQSRRCDFHPVDFLKEVRKVTSEVGTCLIFDEVITGFRIHPGGAQAYFGIRADLCTYGKIVGGGMPIGVISGKAEYMDALDGGYWEFGNDSSPTVGVTYFAGTFVRHPLALAAAKGALEIIKEGGEELLDGLGQRAQKFADEINLFCRLSKVPLVMNNFGSLMKPKWTSDFSGGELLFAILRFNGVHVYDGFPWFINLAHTDADLQFVLNAFKNAVGTMQLMGILPGAEAIQITNEKIFDPNKAPVQGARLGRDESGNPAWFMENPALPGEFYMVEV